MDQVAAHLELDEREAAVAKSTAAKWVHLGPCRGKTIDGEVGDFDLVIGGTRSRYTTAIMAMITVLSRENLGRSPPPEAVCRFAAETR